VKPKAFDNILANLSFLLGNLISAFLQKGEDEVSSFHTILLSWSSQHKVIYILKECADMLVGQESLLVRHHGSPKDSRRVFEAL
jgi:hypothetical protein